MRGPSLGGDRREPRGLMPVRNSLNKAAELGVLSLLSPSLVEIIVVVHIRHGRFVSVHENWRGVDRCAFTSARTADGADADDRETDGDCRSDD